MQYEKFDISMTKFETLLKRQTKKRPDIKSKILTLPEFLEYMDWLNKADDIILKEIDMRTFVNPEHTDKEKTLFSSPFNSNAWNELLGGGLPRQPETNYINMNYDISVKRVIRYMPICWISNNFFEAYYSYCGESTIHFKNNSIKLKPGAVLITAPNSIHAASCFSDDCFLLNFLIRSSTFEHVFWNLISLDNFMGNFFRMALSGKENMGYLMFDTNGDEDIKTLSYCMFQESINAYNYCSQMLNSLMTEFFLLILRRHEGTAQLPKSKDFFWKQEYSAILKYISENYSSVSLEELSSLFHYSGKQLGRIVSKYAGMSFKDLTLKLKMGKSAKMLTETNLSINQISEAVGYSNLSSFCRAFNKYFGTPPQKFRLEANNTDIDS